MFLGTEAWYDVKAMFTFLSNSIEVGFLSMLSMQIGSLETRLRTFIEKF